MGAQGRRADWCHKTQMRPNYANEIEVWEDVAKLPEADGLLAIMRGCLQHHHDCTYIYSGRSRSDMDAIFRNPDSPFHKSAIAVPVGSIAREEFIPFLVSKFRSGKRTASTGQTHLIFCARGIRIIILRGVL